MIDNYLNPSFHNFSYKRMEFYPQETQIEIYFSCYMHECAQLWRGCAKAQET